VLKLRLKGHSRYGLLRRRGTRSAGFRSHSSSPGAAHRALGSSFHAGVLLVPIVGFALLLLLWSQEIHRDTAAKPQYHIPPPARCSLVVTRSFWAGHPVYRLTNTSTSVLPHVTLMSWSEQDVPILYVGTTPPVHITSQKPVSQADINLEPGESLWFAASFQTPYKLTVFWQVAHRAAYQVYTAKASS
jgi:hypothetical protein